MYIQNLWTIRNPYGYRDQEFGVFSHNCTCRSLLRSGHVQEWAVDEAIDTLLKVHFLHLFGCQADFHCWCWLLLNIALRLQGLTLRPPERSWSQLAGSFHDSEFLIQNFVGFFINADLQPTIIFNHRPTIASPRVETPRGEPDKKAKQRKLQMNWSFDPRISLVWDLRCTENQIPTRNYNHKYSQIISQ